MIKLLKNISIQKQATDFIRQEAFCETNPSVFAPLLSRNESLYGLLVFDPSEGFILGCVVKVIITPTHKLMCRPPTIESDDKN